MKKKVIYVLVILISLSFPIVNNVKINSGDLKSSEDKINSNGGIQTIPFIVGIKYGPRYWPHSQCGLDPHWSWDIMSFNIISQVCEGLFRYNLSDPSHEIIPNLASGGGSWSSDGLEFYVPLREEITFHDGYKFNASAVKWSFDRLAFLMNVTGEVIYGTLYYEIQSILESLYEWPDGTPIINRTEVFNEYLVKFVLNKPYGAFKALLCFSGSYILSPLSTPATDYIKITDDLVGTGPFVYDEYVEDVNVTFHAYENYWRGKASIDQMIFKIIFDDNQRQEALLTGDIHFIDYFDTILNSSYWNAFIANPNITVLDYGETSFSTHSLGMNNKQISKIWRQSISYAIDYEYMIEQILENRATRLKSPLPDGLLYADSSFNYATFNVIKARTILQNGGIGTGLNIYNDDEWISVARSGSPLATFNYTYCLEEKFGKNFYNLLKDNLEYIGVELIDAGTDYDDLKDKIYNRRVFTMGYDSLQLFWVGRTGAVVDVYVPRYYGYVPDFNDPYTYLQLMESSDIFNQAQVDDPYLDDLIKQGILETDPVIRESIYDTIQQYVVEDLMPWAFCFTNKLYAAHSSKFTGYQFNPFGVTLFYGIQPRTVSIETETGFDVEVNDTIHNVVLTFDEITEDGTTTITEFETGPETPTGFEINGQYYDVTTTATYSGMITLAFAYDETQVIGDEADLKLMHWNETTEMWEDVTTWVDTINKFVYGELSRLSIIVIVEQTDLTAPITTISLSGMLGNENWYISDVQVTLKASDDLSGVNIIEYSYDETNWIEYSNHFTLETEGIRELYYRSIDLAGNIEDTNLEIIQIDKSPPDTELIITDYYTDDENNIFVSYDSTFILVASDKYSGEARSYYRLNSGEWIDFNDPFKLSGPSGTYIIEFYSVDIAGNVEMVNSITVILEVEFEEEFQGYGMLRVNGEKFIGSATLSISSDTIQMKIKDQVISWDVVDYFERCNLEIYRGVGELGKIKVIILRCRSSTYVLAYGNGILFYAS